MIELHRDLVALPLRRSPSFSELRSRAITPGDEEPMVRTLSPEDTLLHLCLHLLNHMHPSHGWQLRYLCDIAHHISAFSIDWELFGNLADDLGARRGCGAVLGLAVVVADATVPAEQIDTAGALALLPFPVPGSIEHLNLAAFLTQVRKGDLKGATSMIVGTITDSTSAGARDWRPGLLLARVSTIIRDTVRRPRHTANQLLLWAPTVKTWEERDRIVAELFTRSVAGTPHTDGS